MGRIRRRVAKLGAGWNPTLEWYALAVEALLQRPVANPTSWTYLAAIHGMDPGGWVSNGVISPSAPLPSPAQRATMWDQCQHGGWCGTAATSPPSRRWSHRRSLISAAPTLPSSSLAERADATIVLAVKCP